MSPQHNWILTGVFFVAVCAGYSGQAIGGEGTFELPDAASFAEQFFSDGVEGEADAVAAEEAEADGVSVTSYDTVSLNVQNTDLADVLQVLSVQGKRNIVPSPSVNGSVTANLYDVTFYEALDAILQQNGAGYREKGNFIYVYTMDELQKIEQAERKVEHKIIPLNYLTATDASAFVSPLLSSAGSIAISGNAGPGFEPSISDGGADSYAHSHTMVVRDYPENLAEIEKVIDALDTRPVQVMVEATILKADVNNSTEFGVNYSILTNKALSTATTIADPVGSLISGTISNATGIQNTIPQATGEGGFKVGVVTNNAAAFIRALDSVTDTTIVANPKLLALNRQRAEVLVGEKVGYLSTTATSTATTQTVEFLDTGTQLTMRPFVSNDGYIRLELKPQLSSANIRSVTSTGAAAVTVPDEITQELTTNVLVQDGQTVVLGGLFKEETNIGRDQMPYLGDIPLAGYAFRGQDDNTIRTEVIFLITPHIVKEKSLYDNGQTVMDSVEMVRVGARDGLLPFSKAKLSAGHLRDALKAIEAGDRETALWEVDMALGIDPTQVEAIRLKEKLVGQRSYWPGNSLLDEAVEKMVEDKTGQRKFRARPMIPDPRPTMPASDSEPLMGWYEDAAQQPVEVVETEIEAETTTVQIDEAIAPVEDVSMDIVEAFEDDVRVAETTTEAEVTEVEVVETAEVETVETPADAAESFETETAEVVETVEDTGIQIVETDAIIIEETDAVIETAEVEETGINQAETEVELAETTEEAGINEAEIEVAETTEETGINEAETEVVETTEETETTEDSQTTEVADVDQVVDASESDEAVTEESETEVVETTDQTETTEDSQATEVADVDQVVDASESDETVTEESETEVVETTEETETTEVADDAETTETTETVEVVDVEVTEPTDSIELDEAEETIETVEVIDEFSSTQDENVMPFALQEAIRSYYNVEDDADVIESVKGFETAEVESVK